MLTMKQIIALMQSGVYELLMKRRTVQRDNDRIVSPATSRALRAIAHNRCNAYSSTISYHRRFG